jgi:hypothetical protein
MIQTRALAQPLAASIGLIAGGALFTKLYQGDD